ncbi:hypothetical protein BaRGS_00028418, partial [Batillaria attramentaria]
MAFEEKLSVKRIGHRPQKDQDFQKDLDEIKKVNGLAEAEEQLPRDSAALLSPVMRKASEGDLDLRPRRFQMQCGHFGDFRADDDDPVRRMRTRDKRWEMTDEIVSRSTTAHRKRTYNDTEFRAPETHASLPYAPLQLPAELPTMSDVSVASHDPRTLITQTTCAPRVAAAPVTTLDTNDCKTDRHGSHVHRYPEAARSAFTCRNPSQRVSIPHDPTRKLLNYVDAAATPGGLLYPRHLEAGKLDLSPLVALETSENWCCAEVVRIVSSATWGPKNRTRARARELWLTRLGQLLQSVDGMRRLRTDRFIMTADDLSAFSPKTYHVNWLHPSTTDQESVKVAKNLHRLRRGRGAHAPGNEL